jgi:hypothetical protein
VTKPLYHSPIGLKEFQVEGLALWLVRNALYCTWQTGCLAGDSEVIINRGDAARRTSIAKVVHRFNGGKASNSHGWDLSIPTYVQREVDGVARLGLLVGAQESGVKQTYTLTTHTGRTIRATADHPFSTDRGWVALEELTEGDLVRVRGSQRQVSGPKKNYRMLSRMGAHPHAIHTVTVRKNRPGHQTWTADRVAYHRVVAEADLNGLPFDDYVARIRAGATEGLKFLDPKIYVVHHLDEDHRNNELDNLQVLTDDEHRRLHAIESVNNVLYKIAVEKVISIIPHSQEMTYDLTMADEPHNFIANGFVVHNCGKSHLPMAGAAMLFEDDKIDLLLLCCETDKVGEWLDDFAEFTELRTVKYMGPPDRRQRIRDSIGTPDGPQVLVTTYETARNDFGHVEKVKPPDGGRAKRVFHHGPLSDRLVALGGLAVVYDEAAKLGNRQSAPMKRGGKFIPGKKNLGYQCHEEFLTRFRKEVGVEHLWAAALTGTKVEASIENAFYEVRLIAPWVVPSMAKFNEEYISGRDPMGRPSFKNISPNDVHIEPWVTPFSTVIAPVHSHKNKSDPDIVAAFPRPIEEPLYVKLSTRQMELYRGVQDLAEDEDVFPDGASETDKRVLYTTLRLVAAHPYALALSESAQQDDTIARLVVDRVGVENLRAMGSSKEDKLIEYLARVSDSQSIVFTFFGQSVLPLLQKRMLDEGMNVVVYHGGMTPNQRRDAVKTFRSGKADILLASDAAKRGLNLPEAEYVISYEPTLTHAGQVQRRDRASRLGQGHDSIIVPIMIALGTVEEAAMKANFRRQGWEEQLEPESIEDLDKFFSALTLDERRVLFAEERRKATA